AVTNARQLLDAWQLLGGAPLPESFARALVRLRKDETLAAWLDRLAAAAGNGRPAPQAGAPPGLAAELRARIAAPGLEAAAKAKIAGAATGATAATATLTATATAAAAESPPAAGAPAGELRPLTFQ